MGRWVVAGADGGRTCYRGNATDAAVADARVDVAGTGGLSIVASLALSGHAAAATILVLVLAVDGMHVIGAGGWIGSLSMVLVAGIPAAAALPDDQGHAAVGALLNAFSPTALVFAGILAVTGAVAGWRNVGSVSALFGPAYGQVLVANSRRARWSSARAPATGSESCRRSGQFMGRRACDGQRPSRSQRRWSS